MSLSNRLLFAKTKRIKKYALYAAGELILIFCGIYLALQLDNWKKNKERQSNEIEILGEIASGFEEDMLEINFNIGIHENAVESCEIVLDHLKNDLPYTDSLSMHFARVLWYTRISVIHGPFDHFKAKGLDIMTNDSLRLKIMRIFDIHYRTIQNLEINTFLPDAYLLEVHATRFDKTEIFKPVPNRDVPLSGTMVPHDYNTLKSDKDYIHAVKSILAKNVFLIEYFFKPCLEDVAHLRTEVLNERDRLLSEYN
jgi:hypothetical protein